MRMPTFQTDPAHEAGFTLVELLAVLAILAIAIAAFTARSGSNIGTANLRALMVRTTAAISDVRAGAIRGAEEKVFIVDTGQRRMGTAHAGISIPDGVTLTATVAESERYGDGKAGIRFYPSGSSSGGTLAFEFRGKTYEIRVNWLTGNASLHPI